MDTIKLTERFAECERKEKQYLYELTLPEFSREEVIVSFVNINLQSAMHHIHASKDFNATRLCFYKAAVIKIYLDRFYDKGAHTSWNFFNNHHGFCYSILSDNGLLIKEVLGFREHFWNTLGVSFSKSLQAILSDNFVELEKQIGLVEKYTARKTWERNFLGTVNALKGILLHDKTLTENGIEELISKYKKQDNPAAVRHYFSIEGTTLAKMALERGLDINVDSLLIPKAMLIKNELSYYEGYEFFKELDFLK